MYRLVGYCKESHKFCVIDSGTREYCMSIKKQSETLFTEVRVEKINNTLETAINYFR